MNHLIWPVILMMSSCVNYKTTSSTLHPKEMPILERLEILKIQAQEQEDLIDRYTLHNDLSGQHRARQRLMVLREKIALLELKKMATSSTSEK